MTMFGSMLALISAFFWASAVILFKKSGQTFSPVSLNIYKSFVALILISLTMVILGTPFFPDKPVNDWLMLGASGLLGITLADLFFFMALNRLNAGLVAIVECLYLPSVVFFAFIFLDESLSTGAVFGGILIVSAVFMGSAGKKEPREKTQKKQMLSGIMIGCLSIVFMAAGIVIIKDLLETTDILWATLVRVVAGLLSLAVIVLCHPGRKQFFNELKFSKAWFIAFPASVCGNYLALLCWMAGMKYTTASRAAIFNQMSTIFIFILAGIFLKEKINKNKTIAIVLAFTGACLTILT